MATQQDEHLSTNEAGYTDIGDQNSEYMELRSGNAGDVLEYSLDDAIEHIGFGKFQVKVMMIAGLSWMADAMEIMALAIITPAIMCEWNLRSYNVALLTTLVFLGQAIGSFIWGYIADKYGRKKGLYMSVVVVVVFGIISSQSPSLNFLLGLRFVVGIGIGGIPQALTITSETLPLKYRGKVLILLEIFWAIGALFAALIAIPVMIKLNWRWYTVLISAPMLTFLISAWWLPESPRFLLITGKYDEAMKIVDKIAIDNGKTLPNGTLSRKTLNDDRGSIRNLFAKGWRRTVGLLSVMCFMAAFGYYGIILLTTEIFQTGIDGCHPTLNNRNHTLPVCRNLTMDDYTSFMWTSTAEFPGLLIALIAIDVIGRRKSLAMQYGLSAISFILLGICTSRTASIVIIFACRCFMLGSFQTVLVYTSEVMPTDIRGTGLGVCSFFARVGGILTPFATEVLIYQSFYYVIGVYCIPLMFCAVAAMLLTVETSGKTLEDDSSNKSIIDPKGKDYQSFK